MKRNNRLKIKLALAALLAACVGVPYLYACVTARSCVYSYGATYCGGGPMGGGTGDADYWLVGTYGNCGTIHDAWGNDLGTACGPAPIVTSCT